MLTINDKVEIVNLIRTLFGMCEQTVLVHNEDLGGYVKVLSIEDIKDAAEELHLSLINKILENERNGI